MIKHGSSDKAEIQGWKWKQGFEIIKKNMKKVVISKKRVVNRRTIYNWKVKLK